MIDSIEDSILLWPKWPMFSHWWREMRFCRLCLIHCTFLRTWTQSSPICWKDCFVKVWVWLYPLSKVWENRGPISQLFEILKYSHYPVLESVSGINISACCQVANTYIILIVPQLLIDWSECWGTDPKQRICLEAVANHPWVVMDYQPVQQES